MKIANQYNKQHFVCVISILGVLLAIVALVSMNLGTLPISPYAFIKTIVGNGTNQQQIALFSIRLPRIVMAILVGEALAVAGTILQSVTNNDLAEPGILGINTGAALFVVIFIYLTNGNNYYGMADFAVYTMPVVALLGGALAAGLIYMLAWKNGIDSTRLLLMGIAINAAFSAMIVVAQLRSSNQDFNTIQMWTSGSIWGSSWRYVVAVSPIIVVFTCLALYKARYLDIFNLGDETSCGLGVHVERERILLILLAVVLAATATSVAGSISFVGLLAPHIARRLTGPRHKYLIVTSMLVGMILVVAADTVARNLFAPIELHLGIVISIIGVPYFLYLGTGTVRK